MVAIRRKLIPAAALTGLCWLVMSSPEIRADVKSQAAQQLARTLMAKFGARAGNSVPVLAQKIEAYAARHGDEALVALRKVGPSAFGLVEAAGKNAPKAVQVLAVHGEAGATRVLSRPKAMGQFLQYGEQAATVLVRHPGVAEGVIERGGMNAVRALGAVTPRNGRRVAMLLEGDLAKTGKHAELLEVIARYGDRAAVFVWENKGSLAVGTALTAFLLTPKPFLDGIKDISKVVGENALRPLAEVPGQAVKGVVSGANWTVVILVVIAGAAVFVLVSRPGWWARMPTAVRPAAAASPARPEAERDAPAPLAVPKSNVQPHTEGGTHGIN